MKGDARAEITQGIVDYLWDYCEDHSIDLLWGKPLVGFADANHPRFAEFRSIVHPEHYMPSDILPGATIVVSYFLPFERQVARTNIPGDKPSPEWAFSYLMSNEASIGLGERVARIVRGMGFEAVSPRDIKRAPGTIVSRWSQRHIANLAGLGTFGMNNMLITEKGCCGRFYSVVTTLDVEPDGIPGTEYCTYRRNGGCGLCMDKCRSGALTPDGFERDVCDALCNDNGGMFNGLSVCGKCVVGMPCSHRNPSSEVVGNRLGYRK
ncbi:MAG: hypothetical protein IJ026_01480 [Candidatus Methanomethylophilaceae archaeon]|nr:hypothetical protein [Candidatus Methanomethylophilaceae archaeon]